MFSKEVCSVKSGNCLGHCTWWAGVGCNVLLESLGQWHQERVAGEKEDGGDWRKRENVVFGLLS